MVVFTIKKLIVAMLIPFLAILTVQICLRNPKTREMFTDIEDYENVDYSGIDISKEAEIEFCKSNDAEVELYFNGEKVSDFNSDTLRIKVECDGVFEIKNNGNRTVTITASCVDYDVIKNIINTEFDRGISPVCEININ